MVPMKPIGPNWRRPFIQPVKSLQEDFAMHSLTLYGTAEDRIMIEGEFHEEVDTFDMEEGTYIAISDGTLLMRPMAP